MWRLSRSVERHLCGHLMVSSCGWSPNGGGWAWAIFAGFFLLWHLRRLMSEGMICRISGLATVSPGCMHLGAIGALPNAFLRFSTWRAFVKSFSYFVCCVTFALVFWCLVSSIFLCSSETVHYTYRWCDCTAPHWPFCNMRLCQKASAASQAATLYRSFYR